MHTSSRSAPTSSAAQWSPRTAIASSARSSRIAALVAAVVALTSTLDVRVPLATGVVMTALVPAILVDVIERRLPNRLVAGAALVGVATLTGEVFVTEIPVDPVDLLVGALAMAGPLLLTHLARPAALGFGDVKCAVVIGAALGLVAPVVGLAALTIGSAGTAVVGMIRRRHTVAFGPGLLGGAVIAVALVASPLAPLDRGRASVAILDATSNDVPGSGTGQP
jgi:leader peptidase (prepilin peptidase)/N-methyltransferase